MIVAPPDRHLVVEDGRVRLSHGPRENGHRPAIDPLMRSLAAAYGAGAAGLVLSGTRDDGTVGLSEIKPAGGVALVQDPEEAEYSSMPASAMAATPVDAALPAAALAGALDGLARGRVLPGAPGSSPPEFLAGGAPLTITCPDCGGVLTEADEAGVLHFRCHVGHAFSPRSLLALHADGVERAMWTAARSLEELQSTNEELETINDELRTRTLELNEVNAFLETILASMGLAVAVLDARQTVQIWNRHAEDLWGLRADEAVGQHFLGLDIGLPVDQLRTTIRDALRGVDGRGEVTLEATNRRGRSIHCTVRTLPLVVGTDEVTGVILLMEQEDR